jgi:transglutaminase-like putative cysteine protease
MALAIETSLVFDLPQQCDLLLQIEAAILPEQTVADPWIALPTCDHFARMPGHGGIGERIWLRHQGRLEIGYRAVVTPQRRVGPLDGLAALPPHLLPGDTVDYLMDSTYCPATRFQSFVAGEFAGLSGGALIAAMRDWVSTHVAYVAGSSTVRTGALDTFLDRQGVCRDFAHLLVAFARAAAIPARFASVYAPDVSPQDFHAVAEVFLDAGDHVSGCWHLVDATGMADPAEIARIGVGRDAADASFLTAYGAASLLDKAICVTRT